MIRVWSRLLGAIDAHGRAAMVTVVAQAVRAIALLSDPAEDPRRTLFAAIYLTRATALIAVAAGLAALYRAAWSRSGLALADFSRENDKRL